MNDLIGRTLKGKLRITSQLGDGAMGTVYRGVEIASGKDVAIKVMRPDLMKEPGMLTRFRREATAMRRVRHPNAVEVLAYGIDDGLVFLAMELVEGSDLAEIFAKQGRFAPDRAARILADVCSALVEAHSFGLVHRDIKPENIMLGGAAGDTVKLIDFGIAKPTAPLSNEMDLADEESFDDSIPNGAEQGSGLDLTTAGDARRIARIHGARAMGHARRRRADRRLFVRRAALPAGHGTHAVRGRKSLPARLDAAQAAPRAAGPLERSGDGRSVRDHPARHAARARRSLPDGGRNARCAAHLPRRERHLLHARHGSHAARADLAARAARPAL